MAYPEFLLLAFGGRMGTVDQWSCSVKLTSQGYRAFPAGTQAEFARKNIEGYRDIVAAYVANASAGFNGWANLNWVKLNPIGGDGRYRSDQTVEIQQDNAMASGGGGAGAFQLAVAVTLTTDVRRGLANKGRYFIPAGSIVPDEKGQISITRADQYRDAAREFINNLNSYTGSELDNQPNPKVHVISRGKKSGNTWGEGVAHPVTGIALGRAPDTQSRRRKGVPEDWELRALS